MVSDADERHKADAGMSFFSHDYLRVFILAKKLYSQKIPKLKLISKIPAVVNHIHHQ